MPPRNVIPKPHQRPHPPLWVACSRRETIRMAAEKGIGALSFSFVEPEEAKTWVDEYYEIIGSERCVPAGFAINPNIAITLPMMVHADEAEAIDRGIDGAHFFGYALAHYYLYGRHRPGQTSIWEEFLARREQAGFARSIISADRAPLGIRVLQHGLGSVRGAIGTPDQVRDLVRRYEEAGVDEMMFLMQTGRTDHRHICEALELFAAEVMPEFRERRAVRGAAKRVRLGVGPERALARRAPARTADPDYTIVAGETPAAAARAAALADPRGGGEHARAAALRGRLEARGEQAFRAFVKRAGDRRLEQTVGSRLGLRAMFGAMERRFVPDKAAGFEGDIQYDLRTGDDGVRSWTVSIDGEGAHARSGRASDPALTVTLTVADFARLASGELNPVNALLTGQLDLVGDFAVAARLGEMFGQPGAF
jgi:alkanesulfonate monooxygenase SsuD/methylene tetrahydromethanopterin reductase-like flavin-dependent oxidoreductase (luciferase family)